MSRHGHRHGAVFKQVGVLADTILTIGVFLCVFYIKHLLPEPLGGLASSASYGQVLLMIIIIWYTVSTIVGRGQAAVYTSRITGSVVMGVFKTTTISVFLLIIGMYLLKVTDISRALIAMFYVADLLLLVASRWVSRRLSFAKYRDEYSRRQILVIGSRSSAQELVRMVIASKESSDLQIVGCVDLHREDIGKTVYNGVKVIGTLDDLRDILFNQVVDEILIAMPLNKIENSEWYLSFINAIGITVRIFPDWYIRKFMSTHASRRLRMDRFLSEPALVISRAHVNAESLAIKTILDFLMAAFFLIVTSPLMLGIALLIKLFSPGPVFYSQIRSGQDGRKFSLLKFRSMVVGAEKMQHTLLELNEASGPVFKIKKDPRIIPFIGTFIRKTSFDELPQFINVLRGEMSIVGPRPPTPSEVEKYELWQRRRLSMKPGITCIWQIQPRRNDITFEHWMDLDMDYIDHWSLWLDFKIILKTVPAMLFGSGR